MEARTEGTGEAGQEGLRLLGIAVALGACGVAQWYIRRGEHWTAETTILVVCAVVAAILAGPPPAPRPRADPAGPVRPAGRWWWIGAGVAVAGFAAYAAGIYWLRTAWHARFDIAAPLTLAGVLVWSVGLGVVQRRWWPRARVRLPWWEWTVLLAITAAGAFLRFHRFDYYPPPDGVCAVEEPQAGMIAYEILRGGERPWEFLGDRWLPVPLFAWLGVSLTTLRIPFAIVSALTVPALYLVLRQVVARPVALLATALFAVCAWHIQYARLGHNIFATTLVVVILYALCLRVHRHPALAWYPWIGFLSAYTLYTYAGYRGTTFFVGLFLLASAWTRIAAWRRAVVPRAVAAARRDLAAAALGLGLAGLALAGPVLVLVEQLRKSPAYYFEAANRSLLNEQYYTRDVRAFVEQRVDRLLDTAAMFNHVGDASATFNLPLEPMLDPVTGTLFPVGLAYCLIWWRHRWQGFFALTFLLLLLVGTTFVQNLDIRRLQGIIPLIFVLVAFFLDRVWRLGESAGGRPARAVLASGALALAAVTGWLNYERFFVRTIGDPAVREAFQNRYTVLVRYVRSLPADAYVYVVGATYNFFLPSDFRWLLAEAPPGEVTGDLSPVLDGARGPWTGRDLRLVVESMYETRDLGAIVAERFPTVPCRMVDHPDTALYAFLACDFGRNPPPPRLASGGVRARYYRGDDPTPFLERLEPAISFGFQPRACRFPWAIGQPPCRGEWEGQVEIPTAGRYAFLAEGHGSVTSLSIDGRPVRHDVELDAGRHTVRMTARYGKPDEEKPGVRLRWLNPRTNTYELVRFTLPPP